MTPETLYIDDSCYAYVRQEGEELFVGAVDLEDFQRASDGAWLPRSENFHRRVIPFRKPEPFTQGLARWVVGMSLLLLAIAVVVRWMA